MRLVNTHTNADLNKRSAQNNEPILLFFCYIEEKLTLSASSPRLIVHTFFFTHVFAFIAAKDMETQSELNQMHDSEKQLILIIKQNN